MLSVIIIASVLGYATIGAWTFGYMAGVWAKEKGYNNNHYYYYDEPGPWIAGIFWPFTFLIYLVFIRLAEYATKVGVKAAETRWVRIELEKKIRVEQEKVQQQIEAELEEDCWNPNKSWATHSSNERS